MNYSIAIDGPSGAGKSTISKLLAKELGFQYLDTGAMYRALTYYLINKGIDLSDQDQIRAELNNIHLDMEGDEVLMNDQDVSQEIRSSQVTNAVSQVSSYKAVREFLVHLQRQIANNKNTILDGRDIGTVVIPDAFLKFFLTASVDERAKRRFYDKANTSDLSLDTIRQQIEERDYKDSHREISPLKQADDAILIDSTDMTIEEVINFMKETWENKKCSTKL